MSLYPRAIKKLIAPGANDPRIKPTCVILHVAVSEGASLYSYFNGPSGGVESHFYVRRDGTVEQYRDTDYQADAQLGSAWNQISVETQGMGSGEWTPAQLTALRDLIRWAASTHGFSIRLNDSEANPRGVGWHAQYRSWSGGDGRTCPGPDRVKQIPALVASAAGGPLSKPTNPTTPIPQEDDMSAEDFWTKPTIVKNMTAPNPDAAPRVTPSNQLEASVSQAKRAADSAARIEKKIDGLATSGAVIDYDKLAAKVADLLAARLKA